MFVYYNFLVKERIYLIWQELEREIKQNLYYVRN